MIGSLRGELLARSPNAELLVEVNGVGYRVQATKSTAADLGPVNSDVFIFVYHVIREDAEQLYGFSTNEERHTFEVLVSAHRVGPTLALAILDVHRPMALRQAVAVDDVDALCRVPGIGPKTAVRLLVELKSKLDLPEADAPPATDVTRTQPDDPALVDVRSALAGLGYSAQEIRQVITKLPESTDPQELIREALRLIAGVGDRAGRGSGAV